MTTLLTYNYTILTLILFWCRNAKNKTPLDLAYQMEDSDTSIVLHLIERGADVGCKPRFHMLPEDDCGFNFLDWAIERKHG